MGHIDAAGYFYIHGRDQDTLVRHGEFISLPQIASKLRTLPTVEQAEIVQVPSSQGVDLVAVIVSTDNARGDDLRASLNTHLSATEHLSRVVVLPQMPVLASGKIDRLEVQRRALGEDE